MTRQRGSTGTGGLAIGLDVGTTHGKVLAVDTAGTVHHTEQATWSLNTPEPGAAEQDGAEVIAKCLDALERLAAQIKGRPITGLALSGAMHTLVPVDAHGRPLGPATTWADTRSADCADELSEDPCTSELYRHTGCRPAAIYHPARLRWTARQHPRVFRGAKRFVAIKDALLHYLTGRWVTDRTLASSTGMLDLATGQWDRTALCLARIEPGRLPEPIEPASIVGPLTPEAARRIHLPEGVPVAAGASDGALSNAGAGAVKPGQVVVNVGTSGAIRINLTGPWLDGERRTWCYRGWPSPYLAGGAINNAGLLIQWLTRVLGLDEVGEGEAYSRLFELASRVEPGSEGVLVLPYLTGERNPHWAPRASAAITGLQLAHGPSHLARAGLEAVAFCLADVWQALRPAMPRSSRPLRVTGSITRQRLWLSILADVLGRTLEPVEASDASAFGAAMLAHTATGKVRDITALTRGLKIGAPVKPDPTRHRRYRDLHRHFQSEARRVVFSQP